MSKTGFILLWTSALTIVLLLWLRLFPPYQALSIPDGLKNFVDVRAESIDLETLENLRK